MSSIVLPLPGAPASCLLGALKPHQGPGHRQIYRNSIPGLSVESVSPQLTASVVEAVGMEAEALLFQESYAMGDCMLDSMDGGGRG